MGEMSHRYYRGEGTIIADKVKREQSTEGNEQEELFPKAIGWERQVLNFMSSCNQQGLKSRVKGQWSQTGWRPEGTVL